MPLFQTSVLKSYLALLDEGTVDKAYKKYQTYFWNTAIQENIKTAKEEQYQATFLNELFVNVLGYTLFPNPSSNLTTEFKNEKNARKADGAILKDGTAIAVIELKGTNTKDLESIRRQAFDYKANQKGCVYVVTSNFEKLRFYINDATEFEEFDLFTLSKKRFELLYLCLHKDKVLNNTPLNIKEASIAEEEEITKAFYNDYSIFKRELYRDLVKNNAKTVKSKLVAVSSSGVENDDQDDRIRLEKNVKLTLFQKSQKLIDRFLFIFFAEDRLLLPSNSTLQILNKWKDDWDFGDERPLYGLFKQYFNFLDSGRKGTEKRAEIYAYNGGLFKPDAILDALDIDNDLLYTYTQKLSNYDFESQVDVNILGHIFENSLNEIESVNAEIEGDNFDKQTSKRKKDGVFYTPKYITKYIVENTVGKLCNEKKEELGFDEEQYFRGRKNRNKTTIENLVAVLDDYRAWLLQITICDPACGSGAFLNQALDFLIKEHTYIDELKTRILGGGLQFPDIENTILENNIYGVDLNEESLEIAKLSLWLRTAQPRRKLNDLSSNIKCGNSLIDDKKVAGNKTFNWEKEFPNIFKETEKKAFHVTCTVHDSRTSERMKKYKVRQRRKGGTNPYPNIYYLTPEDDLLITQVLHGIVKEDQLKVMAYNCCADHLHLILVCAEDELSRIMQKIKAKTARAVNIQRGITIPTMEHESTSMEHAPLGKGKGKGKAGVKKHNALWSQKFGAKPIDSEDYLSTAIKYVKGNRSKHKLPEHSVEIKELIADLTATHSEAFNIEYGSGATAAPKQGFDVVIGNPPYVRVQSLKEYYYDHTIYYEKKYKATTGNYDIYALFIEKSYDLINKTGYVSFILPHKFLIADFGQGIRTFLLEKKAITELVSFGSELVFQDATTYTCIINLAKTNEDKFLYKEINPDNLFENIDFGNILFNSLSQDQWILTEEKVGNILDKLNSQPLSLKTEFKRFVQGIITGKDAVFCVKGVLNDNFLEVKSEENPSKVHLIEKDILKPHLRGQDIKPYTSLENNEWLIFPYSLESEKAIILEPNVLRSNFPKTLEYLEQFETILKNREKGKFDNKYWYQYSRNQAISVLEQQKLITPEVCYGGSFTFDLKNYYHNSKCHTLLLYDNSGYSYKSILPILNSKLFWFYLSNSGNVLRGGYIGVKRKVLEPFGLPLSEDIDNKRFEDFSNSILSLTKSFERTISKFEQFYSSQYSINKLSKKLKNWHELEFGEFIKELNKAINKENRQRRKDEAPEISKLTKKDEFEWLELFEENKAKAQDLQTQITTTERDIDQMVYELYGLTDEEIAIVENA